MIIGPWVLHIVEWLSCLTVSLFSFFLCFWIAQAVFMLFGKFENIFVFVYCFSQRNIHLCHFRSVLFKKCSDNGGIDYGRGESDLHTLATKFSLERLFEVLQ